MHIPRTDEEADRRLSGAPPLPTPRFGSPEALRDQFAGEALMALLINPGGQGIVPATIAERAYSYADAMLRERRR